MIDSLVSLQEQLLKPFLFSYEHEIQQKNDALKDLTSDKNFSSLESLVIENHYFNCRLWTLEDKARDKKSGLEMAGKIKYAIDPINQKRNDAIEKIDREILMDITQNSQAPFFSETPGSILDRLSISNLKIYHSRLLQNEERVNLLETQNRNLKQAFSHLLSAIKNQSMQVQPYFQLKMYNKAETNPHYSES